MSKPKDRLVALFALAMLALPVAASAETASRWEPPAEGAAEMFRQGDRVFAVGAASGGAGFTVVSDGGETLKPSPGGETYTNSRCAMQSGTCGGTCVMYMTYYCSTDTCASFDFC